MKEINMVLTTTKKIVFRVVLLLEAKFVQIFSIISLTEKQNITPETNKNCIGSPYFNA